MSKMKVSVIIPVYNAEKYLDRCLASIYQQTFSDYEIILIDDGSKDRSREICQNHANICEKVRLFSKENGGVSSARNLGLEHTEGEYIAFIDADDYIAPDYLETLYANAVRFQADISCCDLKEIIDREYSGIQYNPTSSKVIAGREQLYDDYIERHYYYTSVVWGKLFKRSLISGLLFKNMKYGEDTLFVIEASWGCKNIYYDNYAGYFYCRENESATISMIRKKSRIYYDHINIGRWLFDRKENLSKKLQFAVTGMYARKIYLMLLYLTIEKDYIYFIEGKNLLQEDISVILHESSLDRKYKKLFNLYIKKNKLSWLYARILALIELHR